MMRKLSIIAGISVLAAVAGAVPFSRDAQISIDRALNSPTLTVRYAKANAALVELRVNGESLGTRAVDAAKAAGETNFGLATSDLKDGDNEVEIRLFDRTGKLVGREKINISTDQGARGPVFLQSPKMGQTVQGPVDIKLGFGRDLSKVYVSFFIDNNYKGTSNVAPFSYIWDTIRENNGWHEIEAWAIDETSTTFKTRKTRVFVNNPGGPTSRNGVNTDVKPVANPIKTDAQGTGAGLRTVQPQTGAVAVKDMAMANPNMPTALDVKPPVIKTNAQLSKTGIKSSSSGSAITTGPRTLTPTGTRNETSISKETHGKGTVEIVAKRGGVAINSSSTAGATGVVGLVSINKGVRLPNVSSFAVLLNSKYVNFDVPTRVDGGIPMTPFRHLIEQGGGTVTWEHMSKSVKATAEGQSMFFQVGDKFAKLNNRSLEMELAPYIDRGRTIVPLSFIREALKVNVEFDKASGHVLITSDKK